LEGSDDAPDRRRLRRRLAKPRLKDSTRSGRKSSISRLLDASAAPRGTRSFHRGWLR
jgi:hypothetical protein